MKETPLWKKLRPALNYLGTFQKISDRFTPGVPDVLGCFKGRGFAIELKEIEGVKVLKVKFRPNQLDWLEEWEELGGGRSWIIATHKLLVVAIHWTYGEELESGVSPERLREIAKYLKEPDENFRAFCHRFLKGEYRA